MKKSYISPVLYSVRLNMNSMLAGSLTGRTDSVPAEDAGAELGVKGSHYSVWDDDWSN